MLACRVLSLSLAYKCFFRKQQVSWRVMRTRVCTTNAASTGRALLLQLQLAMVATINRMRASRDRATACVDVEYA